MKRNPLTVALDARLIGAKSTGDSTYWQSLVEGFVQLGAPVRLLLLSNAPRPESVPTYSWIEWHEVPGRGRLWSLVQFPLAARRLGADIIHTQYNISPLAGRKGVTTIHDVSFFIGPEWFKPKDRLLLQKFVLGSAQRAQKIITVSHTSKGEIETYIPAARGKVAVTLLGPPIHLECQDRAESQALVHSKLSIASPYVLTVGTLWPRKNMALAVEAMESLSDSLPHRLAVTGKAAWASLPTAKRTIATGYVSDSMLSALYSGAELFLVPSRHEGFGLTVLEAYSMGCPVLSSCGGSLPEVCGDAAKIMNSWEAPAWAEAIQTLLEDSSTLNSMREKGLARASSFSWKRTAEETLAVYLEVAHAQPHS